MARTIEVDFSVKGLNNLKKQLIKYKNDLQYKVEEYVSALSDLGVNVAQTSINESPLGKYVTLTTNISPSKMGCSAILIAVGEVKQAEGYEDFNTLLAIEFGAGIHHNPIPNPKAEMFGLGVGTFPGQTHAFEQGWWYWDEKAQEWRYTQGVKATMPMYKADIAMIQQYKKLAQEIFGR